MGDTVRGGRCACAAPVSLRFGPALVSLRFGPALVVILGVLVAGLLLPCANAATTAVTRAPQTKSQN